MLDFAEVGRRMAMRQQMAPTGMMVAHVSIVAPLVGQLLDPEYTSTSGTALLTAAEANNLGQTLHRQAELLDQREQEALQVQQAWEGLNAENARLERRVWMLTAGIVVCAAWLSAIVIAVMLAKL
jgi:hypothetical protein